MAEGRGGVKNNPTQSYRVEEEGGGGVEKGQVICGCPQIGQCHYRTAQVVVLRLQKRALQAPGTHSSNTLTQVTNLIDMVLGVSGVGEKHGGDPQTDESRTTQVIVLRLRQRAPQALQLCSQPLDCSLEQRDSSSQH